MGLRLKVYSFIAVLALVSAAVYGYRTRPNWFGRVANASSKASEPDKKNEKESTPVELATAAEGSISSFITATANLRALRDVSITPQVDGVVLQVLAEEGDFVKDGQILCVLDDAQHKIRIDLADEKLAQAKLQMDKARIRMEKAAAQQGHTQLELTRYQKAHKEGLVSEKEVAAYQYKLEELDHDHKVADSETKELLHRVGELEAEIAQAKLDISRTKVTAPYAGYVTQRTVNLGQRVRIGDPLLSLGSFSPLFADAFLAEREAREVRPGQEVVIRLGSEDSQSLKGRVLRLSPVVDQSTGTIKVTVELQPSNPSFRPGAFVRVDIRNDTHARAVLIPKRAVLEEDGQHYVYIASGTAAKRTKVELGYENEGRVEIRNGVAAGQKVVVAGQGALKEGSKIRIIQG
jgi:membrane fusion protein (multidrug efflux system)